MIYFVVSPNKWLTLTTVLAHVDALYTEKRVRASRAHAVRTG